jgi:hypothetical protein
MSRRPPINRAGRFFFVLWVSPSIATNADSLSSWTKWDQGGRQGHNLAGAAVAWARATQTA